MQQQISFHILQELDPFALCLVKEHRVLYYASKRVLDFVLASLAFILLSPVMAVITILIKLDSSGPIFFVQDRVGVRRRIQNGVSYWQQVVFRCYKFRTMECNADPSLHQAYIKAFISNDCNEMASIQGQDSQIRKLTKDPRVTRLGRILRKSSLDELPQLFNVINGEMSLVGPRPAIPYEVEMYKPWHYKRLGTKPGMTGLWQVTARCSTDFDTAVKLDIEYIERQSIWLDFKILVMTPYEVLSCKGAH